MTTPQVTRWWWIRHAPVTSHRGRIYGQTNVPADCSDPLPFRGLARLLPADAVWVASHLGRTHQTAAAIHEAAGRASPELVIEPALAEQHFGDWQGLTYEEAERRDGQWHRFWLAPARHAPPGGESFADMTVRVAAAVDALTARYRGRNIVAVAHGGTIRAALALALGLDADRALGFAIDNCSLTRIDHIHGAISSHEPDTTQNWRVATVNQPPVGPDGR